MSVRRRRSSAGPIVLMPGDVFAGRPRLASLRLAFDIVVVRPHEGSRLAAVLVRFVEGARARGKSVAFMSVATAGRA